MTLFDHVVIEQCPREALQDVLAFYDRCGDKRGLQPSDDVWIAKKDGDIIGAARLCVEDDHLVLRGMQVALPWQRQGIGRRLLIALDEAIGGRECFCIPYAHLEAFYGRIGYMKIDPCVSPQHLQDRQKRYSAEGAETIMMRRQQIRLSQAVLRRWRHGDEQSLVTNADNRRIWMNLRDRFPSPYTANDAAEWISMASRLQPLNVFAIAVDDQAVGSIGVEFRKDVHRRSAEIGFWLGEAYWGKGIMTEAVRAVTKYACDAFDLRRLDATVFEWNRASARVLEKAGYRLEGRLSRAIVKDGRTIDSLLYAFIGRNDVEA